MPAARRIGQDDLRNHNMSVVLSTVARSRTPMSRAALAKSIGLTKATMSLLTDILLKNGVLRELAPVSESSYGRPATPLAFESGRWAGIGMQINTDGVGYLALDISGGVVLSDWHERTMVNVNPATAFAELDDMMRPVERELAERGYRVAGSSLALPGLVTNGDRLLVARNFGWHDIDLNRYPVFSRLSATADNEATLAAIAQIPGYASQRADRDWPLGPLDSFVYVSTDIGIGGAYVREGQIVRGDHGFAGEIGHICVDLRGTLCRCGRHGCLETIAGRRALAVAAGLGDGDAAVRTELLPDLYAAWRGGDTKAALAVENALSALAAALASTVNMIDMENIVLGGLWSGFGDGLRADLERRVQAQILARDAARVRLMFPPVTEHPAMHGAAVMGLRRLFDNPMGFMSVD
ncbi:ROK family protein [Bifidobacterium amazonense]|uniref:ROK family protein n=1 Tax=Bifidobacterium amazonense TaxID=2809027 RepID=A0ABS9VTW8_9BIFI|nr:ROK family protein [Bifidobacterium amazonense]MCH9275549.1 ROK family protein [Bifidobacterium amazonense]MCH9275576.1 ROK family protein [Bifidobacterium amazonense]